MSKEKELIKNTVIISIGRICTQCISFFLIPVYTSILTTSEYGIVDVLTSYASLLLPLVTLAIEQALFRFLIDVRTENEIKKKIISTVFVFVAVQCMIVVIVLVLIQIVINYQYMLLFAIMIISSIVSATVLQLCRGLGDNIGYTLGSFIVAMVQIISSIFYLVILKLGVIGMLLATITGHMCCIILLSRRTKLLKQIKFSSMTSGILKEMLQYSVPLIPNQLSWWVMSASDKTIVMIFLGTAFNGLLAVAHKFSNVYIQLNSIFNISWTESAIVHINDEDREDFFEKTINTAFRIFSSVCLLMIVCIPFIIDWMVGDESYNDTYYQIPIFLLASLCNVIVSLYGVIYVAEKRTKEIALTAIYAALINVVSHLILVNYIGMYAAPVSSLLGYGTMAVYRYFHSRKYFTVKLENKFLCGLLWMTIIAITTYYLKIRELCIGVFFVVLIYSIIVNIKVFYLFADILKRRMNKK